jgi:hypothetical protein
LFILLLRNDGRVEYKITTQSANRHNFVPNSIENELHAMFQGGKAASRFPNVRVDNSQGFKA